MPVTVSGSNITFNDNTTQTTAGRSGGTTTSSATDITLTSTSNPVQLVTMTATGLAVNLPSATTLPLNQQLFAITNQGSIPFTLEDSSGYILVTIYPAQTAYCTLNDNSTAAGKWSVDCRSMSEYTGGQAPVYNSNGMISYSPLNVSAITALNAQGSNITACALSSTQVLIGYATGATAASIVLATISGTSVSFGTPVTWFASGYLANSVSSTGFMPYFASVALSSTLAVFTTQNSAGNAAFVWAVTVSGSTITVGSATNVGLDGSGNIMLFADTATTGLVAGISAGNNWARGFSIAGTTFTFGTTVQPIIQGVAQGSSGGASVAIGKYSAGNYLVFGSYGAVTYTNILTLSGTTITIGSATNHSTNVGQPSFYGQNVCVNAGNGWMTYKHRNNYTISVQYASNGTGAYVANSLTKNLASPIPPFGQPVGVTVGVNNPVFLSVGAQEDDGYFPLIGITSYWQGGASSTMAVVADATNGTLGGQVGVALLDSSTVFSTVIWRQPGKTTAYLVTRLIKYNN